MGDEVVFGVIGVAVVLVAIFAARRRRPGQKPDASQAPRPLFAIPTINNRMYAAGLLDKELSDQYPGGKKGAVANYWETLRTPSGRVTAELTMFMEFSGTKKENIKNPDASKTMQFTVASNFRQGPQTYNRLQSRFGRLSLFQVEPHDAGVLLKYEDKFVGNDIELINQSMIIETLLQELDGFIQ